jgi:hypothetical protein
LKCIEGGNRQEKVKEKELDKKRDVLFNTGKELEKWLKLT